MKRVTIFSAKDEFQLANLINESKLDIFATKPIQKTDSSWVAFVYYRGEVAEGNKGNSSSLVTSNYSDSKVPYVPSKNQLEKWKGEKVTDKQRKVLKSMGMGEKEIDNASKLDAYTIINNNKKGNI